MIEALLRFYYQDGRGPRPGRRRPPSRRSSGSSTIGALVALPVRRADLRSAARPTPAPGPGADRDRRPLGADDVRVPAHPVPARGAGPGLLRDHDPQRPGDDPAHRRPRRRRATRAPAACCSAATRAGAAFVLALIVVQRRRLSLLRRPRAAAAAAALRPADDAGRALALLAQLHRPDHHRPLASASPRPASTRSRSSSPRRSTSSSAASSSPGRRSPTRSATTTRRAAPTPRSSPGSSPAAPSSSPACGCSRAGSSAPWRRPKFFDSYEAIGLIATGGHPLRALPGPGRDPRPHRPHRVQLPGDDRRAWSPTSPSTSLLVPSLGIVGAGLALVASYVVVLALMYVFTQRLFPVPYEWGRLAAGGRSSRRRWSASASCCCRPRAPPACSAAPSLWAAYPLALLASGFFTAEERALARPCCATRASCSAAARALRAEPAAVDGRDPRGLRGGAHRRGRRAT